MRVTREEFMKIYEKVPEGLRTDIIVFVGDKPYTWNTAFFEIKNRTALGRKILESLDRIWRWLW